MKLKLNKLRRYMDLNRVSYVKIGVIALFCLIAINIFIPFSPLASIGDILETGIAYLLLMIGDGIAVIIDAIGCGLDSLIFNMESGSFESASTLSHMNLTLLKGTSLSSTMFKIYDLFRLIAICLISPIAIWVTVDFIKTADNAQHKAVLKQRLIKLAFVFVLINSLPVIVDMMLLVNQALLDTFRAFINSYVSVGESVEGPFLMETFKTLAKGEGGLDGSIPLALIYIISGFLNIWIAIFYMIRDITISFLFMLAPPIMVLLPYRTDLVIKWFKEMASNIFTQSIQGLVLVVTLSMATSLADGGDDLYSSIFCLVSFALFIPLTANIKKMIGLEGEIGAAKSNAGLGAAVAAVGLAGMASNGIFSGASNRIELNREYKNLNGEKQLLEKSSVNGTGSSQGISSGQGAANVNNASVSQRSVGSSSDGIISPNNNASINRNHGIVGQDTRENNSYSATSRARQIEGRMAQIKREKKKQTIGALAGGFGSFAMGVGASVLGTPGAIGGAALGSSASNYAKGAVTGVSRITDPIQEKAKDMIYGEGIRHDGEQGGSLPGLTDNLDLNRRKGESIGDMANRNLSQIKENFKYREGIIRQGRELSKDDNYMNDILGVDTNMTPEQQAQEREAIKKRNAYERQGQFDFAHRAYAKHTSHRKPNVTVMEGIDDPSNRIEYEEKKQLDSGVDNPTSDSVTNLHDKTYIPDDINTSELENIRDNIGQYDASANRRAAKEQVIERKRVEKGVGMKVLVKDNVQLQMDAPEITVQSTNVASSTSSNVATEAQSIISQLQTLNEYDSGLEAISDAIEYNVDLSSFDF